MNVPIRIGRIDVMVINPLLGTISMFVRWPKTELAERDNIGPHVHKACWYLEQEGFLKKRFDKKPWKVHTLVNKR